MDGQAKRPEDILKSSSYERQPSKLFSRRAYRRCASREYERSAVTAVISKARSIGTSCEEDHRWLENSLVSPIYKVQGMQLQEEAA